MNKQYLFYIFLRIITFPFAFMPYKLIHILGNILGYISYYFLKDYRKRALSNLALATDLKLTYKQQIKIAKKSFQNLAINMLEYPRFAREKHFDKVIVCDNPKKAYEIYNKNKGIIFFCGHQSNWEVLFLDGTRHMKGIAIGKPTKNKQLYKWIVSIREKFGGKIIIPRNAVREGLRNLKKGIFMGIVGDQGMPDSGYSFPFLGRRAWNSPAPALLAYKTNSPIIVAMTRRVFGGYRIKYSDPIWPNLENSLEVEYPRLMNKALTILQNSIKESPGEWLWQHNRWKQQTPKVLYKQFRKDSICIIMPEEQSEFLKIYPHLIDLKRIYPKDFLFLFVPKKYQSYEFIESDEIIYYEKIEELFIKDFRFKLVFNFTANKKLSKHYLNLAAFDVLSVQKLKKIASPSLKEEDKNNLSFIFKEALCRKGSIIENYGELNAK